MIFDDKKSNTLTFKTSEAGSSQVIKEMRLFQIV